MQRDDNALQYMPMKLDECTLFFVEEKDADELAALESACFSSAWSAEQYRLLLRASGEAALRSGGQSPFLVLGMRLPDGTLAAYVTCSIAKASGELEIFNIAVAPQERRQGLGKTLLGALLSLASRLGLERALLEVRESNTAALALYRAMGFTPHGRRKAYYADTGEDALVLCLESLEQAGA